MRRATRTFGARAFVSSTAIGLALLFIGLGAPSAQAACPNEALRQESNLNPFGHLPFSTQLSECRAYELMTPSFKAGYPSELSASADGTSRLVKMSGTVAGAQSSVITPFYKLTRHPSGWETSAISPPASRFPGSQIVGSTPDLTRTLWFMREPNQSPNAKDLYLRDEDGEFVKIGSLTPPYLAAGPPGNFSPAFGNYLPDVHGASQDLSHVVFSIFNVNEAHLSLWPGDTTAEDGIGRLGGYSLYEYVGTGQSEPRLVGVSDGNTSVNGNILPAGTLISSCSTFLGGSNGENTENALSASGETIFFTARGHDNGECRNPEAPEVTEIYARRGGTETVAISEPTPAQCAQCLTSSRSPATYEGATADGSKALFLTEQELLPGANGSNLYEYDFDEPAGQKILRISSGSSEPSVRGVARASEDGSRVYYVASGVLAGANAQGDEPTPGAPNLYLFTRDTSGPGGTTEFVGTLTEEDSSLWAKRNARPFQTTPDGRFAAFESSADLTHEATGGQAEIYEYDTQTETLVRVSVGENGYAVGEESSIEHPSRLRVQYLSRNTIVTNIAASSLALSGDGSTVVFRSRAGLTRNSATAASAEAFSAYEYHSDGNIESGEVALVSDGVSPTDAGEPSIDSSGTDISFSMQQQTVSQDVDTARDLYDARIDGGLPAVAIPQSCEGEGCQASIESQPVGVPASTKAFSGPGNPPVNRHKHHRKRHKQKKHHHKHGGRQ